VPGGHARLACAAAVAITAAASTATASGTPARLAPGVARAARANAPAPPAPRRPSAPSRPPLALPGEASSGEQATAPSPQGELDPLVSNGLASPTCERAGALAPVSRAHCETSGFIAAAAPTGDFGVDVHIDTGVLGLSDGGLLSAVQDLFVTPVWMALVWAVHALVVMLEWCFTIDLLAGASAGGFGDGLRRMEGAVTGPWLPLALATASALALYHGLIRRRVAETAGQVALMAAMMVAGLWVIVDPVGTVGALGQWANQAAIGTLATAAQGSPARPERALDGSLEMVFAAAVEAPWCYLEFGDVEWCRRPSRLDPLLRRAGLQIAAQEQALIGCRSSASSLSPCADAGSPAAKALRRSAELLRSAQSNGAIFLALPANGPARNSINDEGSLLRAICQSSHATSCRGASAAQAEFRTNAGTWSRVGGLVLIAAGLLGMLLLLGFLALRLLAAAIFSLLYLLLAPMMVLAPAFGDGGRAIFRRWSAQLLGTVVSKLLFAFLLGVVLAVLALVSSLSAIGWWTQWLLMSALWWGAFARRHQAFGFGEGSGRERSRGGFPVRRVGGLLQAGASMAATRWSRRRQATERAREQARSELDPVAGQRARGRLRPEGDSSPRRRARRGEESLGRPAGTRPGAARADGPADAPDARVGEKRAQLARIASAREGAVAGGDTRRAAKLSARAERVQGELRALEGREGSPPPGELARRDRARSGARRQRGGVSAARATTPDPAPGRPGHAAQRPGGAARIEVDRELAARREELALRRQPGGAARGGASRPPSSGAQDPRELDDAAARTDSARAPRRRPPESSVMRDLREVEAGRKRQLGRGRP
jgi:hypothetical protein